MLVLHGVRLAGAMPRIPVFNMLVRCLTVLLISTGDGVAAEVGGLILLV